MEFVPRPDQLEFPFSGGRVSLDLTGTVGQRSGPSYERLRSPADLSRWLMEAGLVTAVVRVDEGQLELVRDLREVIYGALVETMAGRPPAAEDVRQLNAAALWPPRAPQLDAPSGALRWTARRPLQAALSTVAREAIELLTSADMRRVKECAAADCSLLFLDSSRSGRRRWCSMARCGNREKTSTYRERRRRAGA
jgi:predicted RNA-binding Zn ribbon-like protein